VSDVPPFHRILLVQACAIVVTILVGVIAVMAWAAWWMITRRRRREIDDWGLELDE
jgi:hypothetical protein